MMSTQLLEMVVARREEQGHGVVVLDLLPADNHDVPVFTAGAHIDVHLEGGFVRQYSLCGDPAQTGRYRIGVLKDPASRGGSLAVHDQLREGSVVRVSAPRNLFPLATDAARSLLIGGGIGITPMIAMAYALHRQGAPFELHYCARSESRSAFVDDLRAAPFASCVHTHFSEQKGRLDMASVLGAGAPGVHVYTCGPAGFMDSVIAGARQAGYPEAQIHREYFSAEVDAGGDSFELVASRSGKVVQVAADQTMIQALASVGIKMEVSCEQGVCGTCLCDVLEGEPDHRDVYLTDEEKAANDQVLTCCSRARSARLVLDI